MYDFVSVTGINLVHVDGTDVSINLFIESLVFKD